MLSLPSLLSLSALSQPPQLRPSSPLHSRAAALRLGLLGAASATLGSAPAFARWDAKKDYMVGAEKNAIDDYEYVQAQQVQQDKFDLNAALVTDYKTLQGMYPHAAGQIAANGPYEKVDDVFKIATATENDKALFKKYLDQFIVLPPGRIFFERINARQST